MAREINLSAEDLQGLENELAAKRSEMYAEQIQFLETLVKRARAGQSQQASATNFAAPGISWTWTYRF